MNEERVVVVSSRLELHLRYLWTTQTKYPTQPTPQRFSHGSGAQDWRMMDTPPALNASFPFDPRLATRNSQIKVTHHPAGYNPQQCCCSIVDVVIYYPV